MGASVAGVGHRLALRGGDDRFGWAVAAPGKLLVVAADGVGSARHGGHGAELAVRAACEHAASWAASAPPEPGPGPGPGATPAEHGEQKGTGMELCLGALMDANAALVATARQKGLPARDLATTMVLAVVERDGSGADVSLARVGDSAAFVLEGQEWEELGPGPGPGLGPAPVSGPQGVEQEELASTATSALPGPSPEELDDVALGSFYLSMGQALVLMTDGLAGPLRDGPSTVAPSLASVLARAAVGTLSPLGLVTALDFSRRGCQDDRALVAAWLVREEQG